MKKIHLTVIAILSIISFVSKAQNSNPWPTSGNVGIGTSTPISIAGYSILSINNSIGGLLDLQAGGTSKGYVYGNGSGLNLDAIGSSSPILFHTNGTDVMKITSAGNVGIGTTSPDSKLAVNGTIHSKEVKVDLTGWSDYVFKLAYKLPSLTEVKSYIDKNQHLPEVPSEAEIVKNGLNLGEMNKLLMKKVEELTLYLIELQKQVDGLKKTDKTLENKSDKK